MPGKDYRSLGNFCGKKISCDNFSRVKFSFSGHPRKFITGFIEKIYRAWRQDERVRKSSVCSWLSRLSWNLGGSCWTICEREPRNAKDRYAVAVQNRSFAYILNYQASLKKFITSCCSHAMTAGIPAYFSTNAGAVPVIHCKPPVSSC